MPDRKPANGEVVTLACEPGCSQTWKHTCRGEDKTDRTCPRCGRINQYWFGAPAKLIIKPQYDLAWGEFGRCEHCYTDQVPVRRVRDPSGEVYTEDAGSLTHWCQACWDRRTDDI